MITMCNDAWNFMVQRYIKVDIRVENNHYFLDIMVGYGYGYRPFKKSYGWLWLGYITILTIITKITITTIITIITIITINGYHG